MQQNELGKGVGINSTKGLHFCLILQVPFSQPRNTFLASNQISLNLCDCCCINSVLKLLCIFLQCLLFAIFIFRK